MRKEGSGVTSAHWVRVGSELAPSAAHRVRCLRQEQSSIRDDLFSMSIGTARWPRLQRSATAQLGTNRFLNRFDGCSARNANGYDTRLCFERTKKHAPRHHHQRHLPQPQATSPQPPSLWSLVISLRKRLSRHVNLVVSKTDKRAKHFTRQDDCATPQRRG